MQFASQKANIADNFSSSFTKQGSRQKKYYELSRTTEYNYSHKKSRR